MSPRLLGSESQLRYLPLSDGAVMEPLQAGDPDWLGKYRLAARLGAGGMGRVYLGFSPAGRAVALKVVHAELARDHDFRERFWREVAAARQVGGVYTAALVDAGTDGDRPWLATAFVPGPSLRDAVAACGPLSTAAAWRLAGGLAEALAAVHACGLVHRDLTPGNVLLAADGPRVIDFGISRGPSGRALTASGVCLGTPGYTSPEQIRGGPVTAASDVFSLGCVLAFAVTGAEPFADDDPATVMFRILYSRPDLADMAEPMGELARWCLAKDPANRPALARLIEITAACIARSPSASPMSFWPGTLDQLIGTYQARLSARAPSGPLNAPPPAAGHPVQGSGTGAPRRGARHRPPAVPRRRLLLGLAGAVAIAAPACAWGLTRAPRARRSPASSLTARQNAPGRKIWSFQTGGEVGSPAVAGGLVYVTSASNAVYALRATDGTVSWKFPTAGPDTAGPAVADGVVYAASYDGNVYALAARGGIKLWSYAAGTPVYGTPAVSGEFVYTARNDAMTSLGALVGVPVWTRQISGNVYYPPVVADGALYIGSSGGYIYALHDGDGSVIWRRAIDGPLLGPVLSGGTVYTGSYDGNVYALRASDGAPIWKHATGGNVTGSVISGGLIYAGNTNGSLYALRLSDGTRIWQHPTGAPVAYAPAVANGRIYAGNHAGDIVALHAGDGTPVWTYRTAGPVQSTPAVSTGALYAGSNDGHVYALRA